ERDGVVESDIVPPAGGRPLLPPGLSEKETADFWDLTVTAASLEQEVLRSVAALEFSHLAKFAFLLCQKINGYYHKYPVLAEENKEVKAFRLLTIRYTKEQLQCALALMGIPLPERM
ncbi:MAG: arginine--tRNA ligase, partial [Candidatus Aminicenantes bacterium]|nr:arginine--tRNA ligase [Candidatus Aminicenantes bacterium]